MRQRSADERRMIESAHAAIGRALGEDVPLIYGREEAHVG